MSDNTNYFGTPSFGVRTFRLEDVTSVLPVKIHKVERGSTVKIFPTESGEAYVFSTNTPQYISDADKTNSSISEGNGKANWDVWGAGLVSEKTIQQVNVPVETIALVVESGTWVIEVTS